MKQVDIAIVIPEGPVGRHVVGLAQSAKRIHFGLHVGWIGEFAGRSAAFASIFPVENDAYVCVRHLAYLLQPKLIVHLGEAVAVSEKCLRGEIVIAQEARRVFCPPAVAENLLECSDLLLRGEELREELDAPPVVLPEHLVAKLRKSADFALPQTAIQTAVKFARIGSAKHSPTRWGVHKFIRKQFGVELVDGESYGALLAAQDCALPAIVVKIVTSDCGAVADPPRASEMNAWLRDGAKFLRELIASVAREL